MLIAPVTKHSVCKFDDGLLTLPAQYEVCMLQASFREHGCVYTAPDDRYAESGAQGFIDGYDRFEIERRHHTQSYKSGIQFSDQSPEQCQFFFSHRFRSLTVEIFQKQYMDPVACFDERSFQVSYTKGFFIVESYEKYRLIVHTGPPLHMVCDSSVNYCIHSLMLSSTEE